MGRHSSSSTRDTLSDRACLFGTAMPRQAQLTCLLAHSSSPIFCCCQGNKLSGLGKKIFTFKRCLFKCWPQPETLNVHSVYSMGTGQYFQFGYARKSCMFSTGFKYLGCIIPWMFSLMLVDWNERQTRCHDLVQSILLRMSTIILPLLISCLKNNMKG